MGGNLPLVEMQFWDCFWLRWQIKIDNAGWSLHSLIPLAVRLHYCCWQQDHSGCYHNICSINTKLIWSFINSTYSSLKILYWLWLLCYQLIFAVGEFWSRAVIFHCLHNTSPINTDNVSSLKKHRERWLASAEDDDRFHLIKFFPLQFITYHFAKYGEIKNNIFLQNSGQ